MEKQKLYFRSIEATICKPLASHLQDAKWDGVTEITLIEAIPDNDTDDFIWCIHYEGCVERHECKKSQCEYYASKSGRGVCQHRGHLYTHGEEVKFRVEMEIDDDAWLIY
jgi:hypothetical protein